MLTPTSQAPTECFVYIQSERKRASLPGERMKVAGEWVRCVHHVTQTHSKLKNAPKFGHYDLAESICRTFAARKTPVILVVVKAGHVLLRIKYDKKLLTILDERTTDDAQIHHERPLVRSLNTCRTPLLGYPDSHVLCGGKTAV